MLCVAVAAAVVVVNLEPTTTQDSYARTRALLPVVRFWHSGWVAVAMLCLLFLNQRHRLSLDARAFLLSPPSPLLLHLARARLAPTQLMLTLNRLPSSIIRFIRRMARDVEKWASLVVAAANVVVFVAIRNDE